MYLPKFPYIRKCVNSVCKSTVSGLHVYIKDLWKHYFKITLALTPTTDPQQNGSGSKHNFTCSI